ncbi:MAG: methyltransferase type 11 [Bacilli bacterium]|nr:methyltransferase type 11 [Bacilli bacterium]
MPINFHSAQNQSSYSSRETDHSWSEAIKSLISPTGLRIADIGCGGGIYARAWADLGAAEVMGVDFSLPMLTAAADYCAGLNQIHFQQGDASSTGLATEYYDVVFSRAVIHHLSDLAGCFRDAFRMLAPGGMVIIQDRTPADVDLQGSLDHIRGYFFERFPRLMQVESSRRPTAAQVTAALNAAEFNVVKEHTLWETRRTYTNKEELSADLRERTGRSILHELTDAELSDLIDYICTRLPSAGPIFEKDRWTIWTGIKPAR